MNVGAVGAQSDRKLFAVHQTHLALRVIRGDAPFPVAIGVQRTLIGICAE